MAPHLSPKELDFISGLEKQGKTPIEIHTIFARQRERRGLRAPHISRFRQALRGTTYKRSRKETRGRKRKYSSQWVKKMNATRKLLLKKAKGEREVRWADVQKASRASKAHRSTVLKSFRREGLDVQARPPRAKPLRTPVQAAARVAYCDEWSQKRPEYFINKVDMIIDNKQFDVPTSERARQYLKSQRVRFHLRTRGEGSLPEMTKPSRKKNRMNTGSIVKVCAGISNGRIAMWEYLSKKWNGTEAAKLYRGAIISTLRKVRGKKARYLLFEDNDPAGYKSRAGKAAKSDLGIVAVPMPAYSPDLNPMDFSLWTEIERRMAESTPKRMETVAAYMKRLRLTALRLPARIVSKSVGAMPKRMRAVSAAKGYSISID